MTNLWSLGGLSLRELFARTWHEIWEDEVFGQASRLAFYHFIAIFPCLLLLFVLLARFPSAQTRLHHTLIDSLRPLLPQPSFALLENIVAQLKDTARNRAIEWSAAVGAIWAAVNGTWAMITGLNTAYEVREERPLWKILGVAAALTLALAIFVVAALGTLAYAARLWPGIDLRWIQWPILCGLLLASFALFYRFGPNLSDREWQWSTPGAGLAMILWLTAAGAMRFYSAHFHSYALIYKQLDGAASLLMWFYFTSAAVLIGGELNSEIEKAARARDGRPHAESRAGR